MKLVTCGYRDELHLGVLQGDAVALPALHSGARHCSRDMLGLIDAGPRGLDELREAVAAGGDAITVALDEVVLAAPVPRPRQNIVCLGWNYASHARETAKQRGEQQELPEHPVVFTKDVSTVNGPHGDVPCDPEVSRKMDWEVELAFIIGRGGRKISADDALGHIFGYTVVNDVTARDLQKRHRQFFLGKSLPGSCPMGPCIVTSDEIPDPQALKLWSRLNGVVKQDSSTDFQIFGVAEVIAVLSKIMPLAPGLIVSTGTPEGVGYARNPPEYLQPGDLIECGVERIGEIANRIVAAT